jgi:hypothetical protein
MCFWRLVPSQTEPKDWLRYEEGPLMAINTPPEKDGPLSPVGEADYCYVGTSRLNRFRAWPFAFRMPLRLTYLISGRTSTIL